jgi:signal transduction histidine kinase
MSNFKRTVPDRYIGNLCRRLCFIGALVSAGTGTRVVADYSDPLYPPEVDECSSVPESPFFRIGTRLKRIDEQIAQETLVLNALAPLQPSKQFDAFGYHSDYLPAVDGVPDEPLWTLDFDAGIQNRRILGVVLVPAIDQRSDELSGYAFPKRFRISMINGRGESLGVYADWTTRDFPDPGMRPVLFRFPSEYAQEAETISRKGLRLEVFSGHEDNGLEFFALGRMHLIRTDELHSPRQVSVSSSFESAPYWSSEYLASLQYTLGQPLAAKDGTGGDLIMELPTSKLKQSLVIRVMLDEPDQLGWVNLFPGHSPDGIDVPGYGFPETIKISRLVRRADGSEGFRRFPVEELSIPRNPGNNMVRVTDLGRGIAALEIACNDFPVYQGQAIFALGEIEILMRGRNLSRGRPVSLLHVELKEYPDLGVLVDGRVDGRNILTLIDWMDQLAAGKPHEIRLRQLEAEYLLLTERWRHVRTALLGSLSILIFTAISVFVSYMLHSRKQAQIRLRRQINSDLHDDIGSKIAAISLASRDVELHASEERVRKRGRWIGSVVETMHQGLRDVLWLTNDQTDTLVLLVQKLAETARQSVPESQLKLHVSDTSTLPNRSIQLQMKRDILFFAREALNNATTHSEATLISVHIQVEKSTLLLRIEDNGRGFDVPPLDDQRDRAIGHFGLQTMRDRVERLDGTVQMRSTPDEGTRIELTVKL